MSRKDFRKEAAFENLVTINSKPSEPSSFNDLNIPKKESPPKNQPDIFRTTLQIKRNLHTKLKVLSAQLKKPMKEVIENALEDYVKNPNRFHY